MIWLVDQKWWFYESRGLIAMLAVHLQSWGMLLWITAATIALRLATSPIVLFDPFFGRLAEHRHKKPSSLLIGWLLLGPGGIWCALNWETTHTPKLLFLQYHAPSTISGWGCSCSTSLLLSSLRDR